MVTPSRRSASFYCYVGSLKLFIIVYNNALDIKIQEIVVPLFLWRNLKIRHHCINAYSRNRIFILHRECNLALQMASTEKLETRAVVKFCQQQGGTPSKTLKKSEATHKMHAVSRTVFFDWHKWLREEITSINDKKGRGRNK